MAGRKEDERLIEKLEHELAIERLERHKMVGAYQLLESQYADQKKVSDLHLRMYNEIAGYLMELETVISQHDATVRSKDMRNKEPRERIKSIIDQFNKRQHEYTSMIIELKEEMRSLQDDYKMAMELLEERNQFIEQMKGSSLDKYVYTKEDRGAKAPILHSPSIAVESVAPQIPSPIVDTSQGNTDVSVVAPSLGLGDLRSTNYNQGFDAPGIIEGSTIERYEVHEVRTAKNQEFETFANNESQNISNEQSVKTESLGNDSPSPIPEKLASTSNSDSKKKETEIVRKELLAQATSFLANGGKEKLNQLCWLILFTIGSQGFNERGEIEGYIKKNTTIDVSTATLSVQFNNLEMLGIIDKEKISTGKRPNVFIHELTQIGVGLYLKEFDSEYKLVLSEKKRLIKMHDNVHHGYFIKDVKSILSEMSYTDIKDDRGSNTIDVFHDGKNFWIPDITCLDEQGNRVYIECELANHTSSDFDAKLHKASLITDVLYFVTRDKDSLKKLQNQLSNWHVRGSRLVNHASRTLKIYATTSNTLSLKKDFGEPFTPSYMTDEG